MINNHMTHIEDTMFDSNETAAINLNNLFETLRSDRLEEISVKIDGSPSVVIGNDDLGFFVSTKSAFNKTPKLYRGDDFETIDNEELRKKLISLYQNYKGTISGNEIYQGDLLFTETDKKIHSGNEKKVLSFQPNTIVYHIHEAVSEPNIENFRIGVAWHTSYRREVDGKFIKHAETPIQSLFRPKREILNVFPHFRELCEFRVKESNDISILEQQISMIFNKTAFMTKHTYMLSECYNFYLKQDYPDFHLDINKLHYFLDKKRVTEISKFKTAKKHNEIENRYAQIKHSITEAEIDLYNNIISVKESMLNKMVPHSRGFMKPFQTNHEGFVYDNMKIVMRKEFSYNNFTRHAKNN